MKGKVLEVIKDKTGLSTGTLQTVHGGDICQAYKLVDGDKQFFVKIQPKYNGNLMLAAEYNGLKELQDKSPLIIPQVLLSEVIDDTATLVLEYLEEKTPVNNDWLNFGRGLAQLHLNTKNAFGAVPNNFIGSLKQSNSSQPLGATSISMKESNQLLSK